MNTMTIEGWCKPEGAEQSTPIEYLHFRISEECHLRLEEAETELQQNNEREKYLDIDMDDMELRTSEDCGPLSDCRLRVYLDQIDHRGQFHLVGHRASDGSLIYSNAVMVDLLG